MKKLIDCVSNFFNSLAQARAASSLAIARKYDEAAKKILEK